MPSYIVDRSRCWQTSDSPPSIQSRDSIFKCRVNWGSFVHQHAVYYIREVVNPVWKYIGVTALHLQLITKTLTAERREPLLKSQTDDCMCRLFWCCVFFFFFWRIKCHQMDQYLGTYYYLSEHQVWLLGKNVLK